MKDRLIRKIAFSRNDGCTFFSASGVQFMNWLEASIAGNLQEAFAPATLPEASEATPHVSTDLMSRQKSSPQDPVDRRSSKPWPQMSF